MTHDTHSRTDVPGSGRAGTDRAVPQAPDRRRWLALVVILIAGVMDLLDVTIVNVAVPSVLKDLHATYAQIEWIVAAYVLGFAALLITGGRLGDIFGRKRIFLLGVAGFTVASALCGFAVSPGMLIGARFFEGAMAGLMVPQILAIIHVTFPPQERGKVFGIWGGVLGSASVAGVVLGGVLVQWNLAGWGWRPIFLVNIPVGVAALVAAWFVVPESRSPAAPRLDLVGMVLAITGVLMLVYPLTEGRALGWPAWTFLLMAGSVIVMAVFVAYERWRTKRAGSPLVVLSLFRARSFSAGMTVWTIFWIALGGFFLVWTLYMQVGLGWTPLHAGLTAVSFAVGAAAGAGLSVQVFTPRFGRSALMAGALLNAAGFAGYAWAGSHYGPGIHSWQMLVPLAVAGFGFGLVAAALVDLILTGVPVRDAGSGSGVLSTTQQVGMALGVALAGVIFFNLLASGSGHGVTAVTPTVRSELTAAAIPAPGQSKIIAGFRACVHDRSAATDPTKVPTSCQTRSAAPGLPSAQKRELQTLLTGAGKLANAHNFARTFSATLWYAASILIAVFLGLFALPRRVRPQDMDTGPPATGRVSLDQ
jgi:EmrB/QacA subfamily drug resistance transporter